MLVSCLECYRKHIGRANGYEEEYHLGYPAYKGLVIGELSLAEGEVLNKFPELAATTREFRKAFTKDGTPIPTLQLLSLADDLEKMENISQTSSEK